MRKKIFFLIAIQLFILEIIYCQDSGIMEITSNRKIHFIVIDPQGRKTGRDPRGAEDPYYGKKFKEIPRANYSLNSIGDSPENDDPQGSDIQHEFLFEMITPDNEGTYQIECYGLSLGFYSLYFTLSPEKESNMTAFRTTVTGIIDTNQVTFYRFEYRRGSGSPVKFAKNIEPKEMYQNVTSLLKLKYISNQGIAHSLQQKLTNAGQQKENGQTKAAINILQAFVKEVNAQQEKGITKEAAKLLIADAEQLIREWSAQ